MTETETETTETPTTEATQTPAPESVLFPNEGEGKPAEQPAGEADTDGKPEGKPEDDKSDDPANKVPEDGKYALKMPEGIELDADLAEALGPEFKDLGLTNAQAQKLVDKYVSAIQAKEAKRGEAWAQTINKWADDAKADNEIGGTKWDGTVSNARRAVERFGTPELREYLNASGGGNHPELIRFMAKVGAAIGEDQPAGGGSGGASRPADPAHVLFPNDAPKG